ncbi:hypothetical protein HD597_005333 [Nonomuraea thailandensis]|uniref:Uncharacterized protein n=1 Tax=Nonomuraea thailandensis TaxID=1188745 RepID=A0A9X2K2S8_9ACTN|nr:hypothetical protein [Nonomuraea thailandensis]
MTKVVRADLSAIEWTVVRMSDRFYVWPAVETRA